MQPQTTTQGRIRDTPLKVRFKKFLKVLRKELFPPLRMFFQRTLTSSRLFQKTQARFCHMTRICHNAKLGSLPALFTCCLNGPTKKPSLFREGFVHEICLVGLLFRLGLFKTDYSIAINPLTTLAKQVDTLEAFEDGAILFTSAIGSFKTVVLCHNSLLVESKSRAINGGILQRSRFNRFIFRGLESYMHIEIDF